MAIYRRPTHRQGSLRGLRMMISDPLAHRAPAPSTTSSIIIIINAFQQNRNLPATSRACLMVMLVLQGGHRRHILLGSRRQ